MRDKDGFIIKCKYSDWEIVDAQDNHDDVCKFYPFIGTLRCYADERCAHYVPDIAESGEDPKPIECEDVISRAEVKRIVDFYKEQYDGIYHINESIDNLPSVTQKSVIEDIKAEIKTEMEEHRDIDDFNKGVGYGLRSAIGIIERRAYDL